MEDEETKKKGALLRSENKGTLVRVKWTGLEDELCSQQPQME